MGENHRWGRIYGGILMEKTLVAAVAGFWLSVTRRVNVLVPAVVGMPTITPVFVSKERPAGNEPAEILQIYGTNPPVAWTFCL